MIIAEVAILRVVVELFALRTDFDEVVAIDGAEVQLLTCGVAEGDALPLPAGTEIVGVADLDRIAGDRETIGGTIVEVHGDDGIAGDAAIGIGDDVAFFIETKINDFQRRPSLVVGIGGGDGELVEVLA